MTLFILPLTDPKAQDPSMVGGKGAMLARLIASGESAPMGFVVTTDVFSALAAPHTGEIERVLAGVDPTNYSALSQASARAQGIVLTWKLPDEIASAVEKAYQLLGETAVAVRSSATAEDLPGASFAGQYETFLNVTSHQNICKRILDVWASLYSPQGVAYRLQRHIGHDGVRMAVVVQKQIAAEASGVLFTLHPVTGANQYVINASYGLGEGVVDGSVPADTYILDPQTKAMISSDIAAKDFKLVMGDTEGVQRIQVPDEHQARVALSERHLHELVDLGQRLTVLLGGPQDIEFAIADGLLMCLQARPVTGVSAEAAPTLDWEAGVDTRYVWRLGQGFFQGPVRRLEEDLLQMASKANRRSFRETGNRLSRNHITMSIHGYLYSRAAEPDEAASLALAAHEANQEAYLYEGTTLFDEKIAPDLKGRITALQRFRSNQASLPKLVEHLEAAIKHAGYAIGMHSEQAPVNLPDWPSDYHAITGDPHADSDVFLQSLRSWTRLMIVRLRGLARLVQADPELTSMFTSRAYERLQDPNISRRPNIRAFKAGFRRLLRDHGLRSSSANGPTWRMDPTEPLDLIAIYAGQNLDELVHQDGRVQRERQNALRRMRRRLANDSERLRQFERQMSRAVLDAKRLDNHNHLIEQHSMGVTREAVWFVGQRLVRDGLLTDPDDTFYFSLAELNEISTGSDNSDLREIVRARAAEFNMRSKLAPPPTLGAGVPPATRGMERFAAPSWVGLDGTMLRGVPASRGRVTGRARVVPQSPTPPPVSRGDILVAADARPPWTPIFPLLGGLVLDGSVLFQHAATVAREYGIPAVIQTRDGTKSIEDGQLITLDGENGTVDLAPTMDAH